MPASRAAAIDSSSSSRVIWHIALSPRAADRDAVHAKGGLADADRHALAVLAAGADAGVELEVVADHADAIEVGRAVADQHRALERRAELAVLDPVSLGHVEHIL